MAGLPARFTPFRLPIREDSDIHGGRYRRNLRQHGLHRIHTCFPFNPLHEKHERNHKRLMGLFPKTLQRYAFFFGLTKQKREKV